MCLIWEPDLWIFKIRCFLETGTQLIFTFRNQLINKISIRRRRSVIRLLFSVDATPFYKFASCEKCEVRVEHLVLFWRDNNAINAVDHLATPRYFGLFSSFLLCPAALPKSVSLVTLRLRALKFTEGH